MAGRLGLRLRLASAFAVGSLVVSAALALASYETSRAYLVRQRERSAVRQAFVNARLLRSSLRGPSPDVARLLASLESAAGSRVVLRVQDQWYGSSVGVGRDSLPTDLRRQAEEGHAARQRFSIGATPQLAVAVPVPSVDALYFEVSPLAELASTLNVLRNSLAAAAATTTVLGAAFGLAATRRVLRPVSAVAGAAADIAAGDLEVNLEEMADPDLAILATSFNAMTAALRDRIERDRRFVSAVSHELRSPLTTLVAAVEVMRAHRSELPERMRTATDLAASEVDRFDRLVQDLLEISRLDAGAVEPPEEEVHLGRFVLHAVDGMAVDQAVVDVRADVFDAVILADKRRLERVLANLVDNANQYGGGVTRVAVERHDDRVRMLVEDSGAGVPEIERSRVFERFFRGRSASARGAGDGTGLGLSIVAEHVSLHGGTVWVESAESGGARFVVELPVRSS